MITTCRSYLLAAISTTLILLAGSLLMAAPGSTGGTQTEADHVRDPFWPIGYVPPAPEVEPEPEETGPQAPPQDQLKWPELKVSGLIRGAGGTYLAIIEGIGIVEAGETVQINHQGILYRWRIDTITARGINVSRVDARTARGGLQDR